MATDFPAQAQRYGLYKFCPCCGQAFGPDDFNAEACVFVCRACDFDFYQNPSPAAVAVITHPRQADSVLLLRRRTPPGIGLWCVPGGFLAYGETPADGVRREAREEVGMDIEVVRLLHVGLVDYAYRGRQLCVVEIGFLARLAEAEAALTQPAIATEEASETAFVPVDDILRAPGMLAFPEQRSLMSALRQELNGR